MKIRDRIKRFRKEEDGVTIVEMAIVLPIFLLIFFALIDFGRMMYHYVATEKAVQMAARIASVRPPACAGVPNFNLRGPVEDGAAAPRTGTQCNAGTNVCVAVPTATCTGDTANPTVAEIWNRLNPVFVQEATAANLQFSYEYHPDLGFLGGPYVPMVTVEITSLDFEFVHPLAAFIAMAGGPANSTVGGTISFPDLSVSLPAEDLAQGVEG